MAAPVQTTRTCALPVMPGLTLVGLSRDGDPPALHSFCHGMDADVSEISDMLRGLCTELCGGIVKIFRKPNSDVGHPRNDGHVGRLNVGDRADGLNGGRQDGIRADTCMQRADGQDDSIGRHPPNVAAVRRGPVSCDQRRGCAAAQRVRRIAEGAFRNAPLSVGGVRGSPRKC